MSILINGEELKLTGKPDVGTEVEKLVKSKIAELRKTFEGRFPLKFRFEDKMITSAIRVDSDFRNERKTPVYPSRPITLSTEVVINNVRSVITWCKTRRFDDRKQKWYNSPKMLNMDSNPTFIKGVLDISEPDADLAFFLLYCHPNINNSFECAEIKRSNWRKEFFYKFVDDQKAAVEYNEKLRYEIKVQNIILNEMNDEQVRAMAILYEIPNAQMEFGAILSNNLFGMIQNKAKQADSYENVYAEFIAKYEKLYVNKKAMDSVTKTVEPEKLVVETKTPEPEKSNLSAEELELQYMTLITSCKTENVIREFGVNSTDFSKKRWTWVRPDGLNGDKIAPVLTNNPTRDLYNEMLKNPDLVKALEIRLSEKLDGKK